MKTEHDKLLREYGERRASAVHKMQAALSEVDELQHSDVAFPQETAGVGFGMRGFWETAHEKTHTLWLTGSTPKKVYAIHQMPPLKNKVIMEIGIGTGDSVRYLKNHGNDMIAVDIANAALKRVEDVAVVCRTDNLPTIPDDSVDFVLCHLVVQHCAPDMVRYMFREVFRVLKPEGVFSFQYAVLESSQEVLEESPLWPTVVAGQHHFYTRPRIATLIEEAGGVLLEELDGGLYGKQGVNIRWRIVRSRGA